jgi:hypothetical protein
MNPEKINNAPDSAGMSGSDPAKQTAESPDALPPRSESQFLAEQAQLAREAIAQTWSEVKNGVSRLADPRKLTRKHPWSALGMAAAAGFAAAWLAVPTKEDRAIRRLARIERAMNPRPDHSIFRGLGSEALKILRPTIISALTAGLTSMTSDPKCQDESPADDTPASDPGDAS